jgi:VRR-NUC domain
MTGAELASTIIGAARFAGWQATHFRPARTAQGWRTPLTGDKGYPDLTLARRGEVLALELKGDRDRLRPEQATWIEALGGPTGGVVTAGLVTATELDAVLAFLLGQADEPELRAALAERWKAVRP